MEFIQYLLDFILHIDQHLVDLAGTYKEWIYLILFIIIFCETGLVVTPFLPGDSLLFAIGALTAIPSSGLDLAMLLVLLIVAAILGDSFNYYLGGRIGSKVYHRNFWFLRKTYIDRTQRFYERYGGRTIIYARFVPIIRTFAPFVAGIGKMDYRRFLYFNVLGALAWVVSFLMAGFLFGNIPTIKGNFSFLILGIMVLSVLPPLLSILKRWLLAKRAAV